MADIYREKVTTPWQPLEYKDSRLEATTAIRDLIEAILLEADGEQLKTLPADPKPVASSNRP